MIWNLTLPYKIKHAPFSGDAVVAYSNETIYPCMYMLLPMDTQRFEPDRATTTASYTDHFTPNRYIVKSPGEASIIQGQSNNIPWNLSSSSQEKAIQAYHSHPSINTQAFPLRVSHAGSSLSTYLISQLNSGSSALITTQRHPGSVNSP